MFTAGVGEEVQEERRKREKRAVAQLFRVVL
jgi:hypothetical protein